MNCSNCCVLPDDIMTSLMPPMLALEFVFGVLGNGLALWIFCFYLKPWKSSQIYLFNLAMADFLLISSLPFRTYMYWNKWDWQIGPISCSATLFMLGMNRQGSTIFLTVVAVDRYFRVVHPHHALNRISNWTAAIVSCVLWGVTISLNCHLLKVKLRPCLNNKSICSSFVTCNTSVWHDAMFFFQFFLPLAIMLFCSARIIWTLRQRHMDKDVKIKRAIRFMLVVTTVFIICFLPCVAMRIGIFILLNTGEITDCSYYHSMHQAFFLTLSFTYMNSILDPLVYYFSSPSFSNFFSIMINRCRQKTSPQQTGCFSSQQDTLVYRLCSPAFSMINCCLRKKPPGEPSANQRRSMEATEDGSTTKSAVEIHGYLSSELWSSSPSVSLNKPAQQD